MPPKWVKVTRNIFGEIQSIVTEAKSNKLKTTADKKIVTVNNMEELIKDSGRISKKAKDRFNAILDNDITGLNNWFKNIQKIKNKY